jgi:asparagine synthase (glutamine-hydrolysing)
MLDVMPHRGPDDIGLHVTENCVLGHTRLSIVDVRKGKQPILAEGGAPAIICNGEIYNFRDLKEELAPRYRFATGSDTETALHLYREEGPAFVSRLDGMFALAIADGEEYLLARDPVGIKPLYYGFRGGALYFSSELHAIAAAELDEIRLFPPGHIYTPRGGFEPYAPLPEADSDLITDIDEAAAAVRETVKRSVHKRLLSDKEIHVGSFCSGGLDSSLVAAIAAEEIPNIHTFAVGMRDRDGVESDDLKAGRIAAEHIGSTHHELVFTADEYKEVLAEVVRTLESYDPSLVRCAVPCYFTCKCAHDHVTVVLTGEGADEVFGGYHYMKNYPPAELNDECRRCLRHLHNINLQRADRMGMRFSLELRVPFLDMALIELGSRLPPELKIRPDEASGEKIEKWILRRAFAGTGYLPDEILWRYKVQYTQGAGCESLGAALAEEELSDDDFARIVADNPHATLQTKEAAYYFTLFQQRFPQRSVLDTVGIWTGFDFAEERCAVSGTVDGDRQHPQAPA